MSLNYYDLNSVTIETRFAPWTHGHSIDAITGLRAELDATQSGLTSTSDIQFHNATIFGNLTPNASGSQNLGAADKHFGIAWIDELHLATSTLYLGDTPVMGTNQDTVEIKADIDQSITLKTTGTGTSKIISQDGVQISSSGMNSDVVIQATGAGGSVAFGAVSSIDFTAPDANFTGDVAVTGNAVFSTATFTDNVVFQGDNITMNTSTFTAQDNRITLNDGEQGSGVTAVYAGFDIDRGLLASWQFVFDEANDRFIYGEVGGTVNEVVSKAYVDGIVAPKLDASAYTAADVFAKVLTLDGTGSGLDADTLDGHDSTYFIKSAQDYMDAIQTIDGAGSLLDADKLDGHEATYFAPQATTYTKTEVDAQIDAVIDAAPGALDTLNELAAALNDDPNFATTVTNQIAAKLDSSAYTAADVLTKIKTVDGSGSGLDADTLDSYHASYFSPSTHTHSALYLGLHAKADDSELLDGLDSTSFVRADINTSVDANILIKNTKQLVFGDGQNYTMTYDGNHIVTSLFSGNVYNDLPGSWYIRDKDNSNAIKVIIASDTGNISTVGSSSASSFIEGSVALSSKYLGISAKAADANLLDGHDSSYFLPATGNAVTATTAASCSGNAATATTATNLSGGTITAQAGSVVEVGRYIDFHYDSALDYDVRFEVSNAASAGTGSLTLTAASFVCTGDIYCATLHGTATAAQYADLAEKYTVEGGVAEPGQVILIGSKVADCKISDEMASQHVLGVVSTDPGMKMNSELEDGHYVALKGRVPCKVFGAVTKGDPLVSYKDGMAISINNPMVAKLGDLSKTPGIILGKALESSTETGIVEVVVL